jgi:predicted NBD/HSP70 family sugar kinase
VAIERATHPAGAPLIRRLNGAAVLQALRDAPSLTASEIMTATGLSRVSAHTVCDDLIEQGLVRELEVTPSRAPSGLGRPSRTYAFEARAGFVVGVDLAATTVTVHLCDLRGEVVSKASRTVLRSQRLAGGLVEDAKELIDRVLAEGAVPAERVLAVAVGVPAPVSRTGRVLWPNADVPGLDDVDLRAALGAGRPWSVLVENDANHAILGERWRGAARGSDHAVMILSGNGLGAGFVEEGRLVRGFRGAAGELHMLSLVEGVGDAGGATFLARTQGLQAVAYYLLREEQPEDAPGARIATLAGGRPERVTAAHVFTAAHGGDEAAIRIVHAVAERIARTVAVVSALLDPEVVVIGGDVAGLGDDLLDLIGLRLRELTRTEPRLAMSTLGAEAVVTGAVNAALDHAIPRLLDR